MEITVTVDADNWCPFWLTADRDARQQALTMLILEALQDDDSDPAARYARKIVHEYHPYDYLEMCLTDWGPTVQWVICGFLRDHCHLTRENLDRWTT